MTEQNMTDEEELSVTLTVLPQQAGERLDAFAAAESALSRSAAAKLIEDGQITVNGARAAKNYRLRAGDVIEIDEPEPIPADAQPEEIPLDVVYEDDDIIVINKPTGMVVHPAPGNPNGTLVNALLWHCGGHLSGIGGVIRPGIVHRIYKDTSGLLVVAKNDAAHAALAAQIRVHAVRRVYTALCIGNFREEEGTVDLPIGRDPADRKRMAVIRDPRRRARQAITHYRVLERYPVGRVCGNAFTLTECRLETGRTHQIRVHMAALGHPILGDPLYGGDGSAFGAANRAYIHGQCLHAGELTLTHPVSGECMRFIAPLPADTQVLLSRLREKSGE